MDYRASTSGDTDQGGFFAQKELSTEVDEIDKEMERKAKRRLSFPAEPPPKRPGSPSLYIHHIDETAGKMPIDLFVLCMYGSRIESSALGGTRFIATDAFGMQTITCTIPSEASSKIRNVVPGKWYRLQLYNVRKRYPLEKSTSDFTLQICQQTTISPLSDETSPPTNFAKSTSPTLKDFAASVSPGSRGTVYAAIIGIIAHGNHKDVQVADNIDENESYIVEFWPEQEEALSVIAYEFYNNLHPVKAFHNLQGTSTHKVFKAPPTTIVCEVPDEEARSKLKEVALALSTRPQQLVGEFVSDQRPLRASHFCCVCKGHNIARRSSNTATCRTCKTDRRFFSRVTLTGTITSGTMAKRVKVRDQVADGMYALQPGEFVATFLNDLWKTHDLLTSTRPFGTYTVNGCDEIVAFAPIRDDDE